MRILFVADLKPGRTGTQRCAAAGRLGHEILRVDTSAPPGQIRFPRARSLIDKVALRLGYHLDMDQLAQRLLTAADTFDPDVIWLDKVLCLPHRFFQQLKASRGDRKVVIYHPDDFVSRFNWSKHYNINPDDLDLIVTTKSYNVAEYHALNYKNVLFVNKTFDPTEHAPPPWHDRESLRSSFNYDVGFVGGYERDRAEMIAELARRGVAVHITGSFWDRADPMPDNVTIEHGDLGPGDYARRIFETKINLAFLRKQNRDLQTARSFEIPACGGFMLSEGTDELTALFRAGVEAVFFTSIDQLHAKCVHYLAAPEAREQIAREGCRRVWRGKSRSDDVVETVLDVLQGKRSINEATQLPRQAA